MVRACEVILTKERSAVRLCLPADLSGSLGSARLLPAIVTINGHPIRTTLHKMGGGYMMAVNAELRRQIGVDAGDTVRVTVEADSAPRTVDLPADLSVALDAAGCRAAFDDLTPFRQGEIVKSVAGAKQASTRARRIVQAVADLARTGMSSRDPR
jgi:hypothetical protein